eukprot:8696123-Pyramimonas_sp.AAC.1
MSTSSSPSAPSAPDPFSLACSLRSLVSASPEVSSLCASDGSQPTTRWAATRQRCATVHGALPSRPREPHHRQVVPLVWGHGKK